MTNSLLLTKLQIEYLLDYFTNIKYKDSNNLAENVK
jgi:hypothetical protein